MYVIYRIVLFPVTSSDCLYDSVYYSYIGGPKAMSDDAGIKSN